MKRNTLLNVGLIVFMATTILWPGLVVAQQQTGQSFPATQVPQTAPGGIFPESSPLQPQSSQDILSEKGNISVPSGKPSANRPTESPKQSKNVWPWIGLVIVIGISVIVALTRRTRYEEDVQAFEEVGVAEATQQPSPKKHKDKTGKKKKRRKHT